MSGYWKVEVKIKAPVKTRFFDEHIRIEVDLPQGMVWAEDADDAKSRALDVIRELDLPALLADRVKTEVELSAWFGSV